MIQEPHRWIHQLVEHEQGPSHKEHNLLGLLDGQGLGHQLAQNNVQSGNYTKAQNKGDGVLQISRQINEREHRMQNLGHRRLTNPAQAQGSNGNT